MSFRYHTPKILTPHDAFIWWCKEKIKAKRHLRIKYENSNTAPSVLVSRNGDELEWLRAHILILQAKVEKYEIEEKDKLYFTKKVEEIYNMKREIMDNTKRISHLEQVSADTEQVIMDEKEFRSIISEFNLRMRDKMVNEGAIMNMKQYLGYMYIQKLPRNNPYFKSKGAKMINWYESKKYRMELEADGIVTKSKDNPEGRNWLVYFTDEYYLKYAWTKKKGACRVKNHNFYAFVPSRGKNGATKALVKANNKDPLLYKKYTNKRIYYPALPKAS